MKKTLILLLVAAMLLSGASALADWEDEADVGAWVLEGQPIEIDLDGDGAPETVSIETMPDDFESFQRLRVVDAGGAEAVYEAEIIDGKDAWIYDLNGDGVQEIFLWGDVMSDDYYTWCLHYGSGRLAPVLFADTSRGDNGRGYFKQGYGALESVDPAAGTVTLCGSQDVLGTYFMNRTLKLSEDGLFELADDGLWVRDVDASDPDLWEYAALVPKAEIALEDGEPLAPGEKFIVTGTDKESVVTIVTEDGREGTISVSEDYMRGWGLLLNDVSEEELFEFLPYAD